MVIVVASHRLTEVLGALLQCLSRLPHLHTISILEAPASRSSTFQRVFSANTQKFRSVTTISLPRSIHVLLLKLPELRTVTFCPSNRGDWSVVRSIAVGCKNIVSLYNWDPQRESIQALVKARAFPNLRHIRVNCISSNTGNRLAALENFPSLETITITWAGYTSDVPSFRALITDSKKALKAGNKGKGKLRLRVEYQSGEVEEIGVD